MKKILFLASLILVMSVNSCFYKKSRVKVISDISFPPVWTFKSSCAKCHGYAREIYGVRLKNMEDEALRHEIEGMMYHKADLNPDSIDVDAMVAYSIALKNDEPFAVAVNSKSFLEGKVGNLILEASPDTKVEINNDKVRIIENQNIYELFYDPVKIMKVEVKVTRNGASSSFDFPDELWVQ
ncbi:MAG: hypothetical protein NTX44_07345 [Ignavibacteriales bacterium]|nr:hypothetical protein [Ignavibacteriales bacterium]